MIKNEIKEKHDTMIKNVRAYSNADSITLNNTYLNIVEILCFVF